MREKHDHGGVSLNEKSRTGAEDDKTTYLNVHLLEYVLDEGGDENDEDTARPVQAQVDRRDGYYPTIRSVDLDL